MNKKVKDKNDIIAPKIQSGDIVKTEGEALSLADLNVSRIKPKLNDIEKDLVTVVGKALNKIMSKEDFDIGDIKSIRLLGQTVSDITKSQRDDVRLVAQLELMKRPPPELSESELIEIIEQSNLEDSDDE